MTNSDNALQHRMALERLVVDHLLSTMHSRGWGADAVNLVEDEIEFCANIDEVREHIFSVDMSTVYFRNPSLPDEGKQWATIVLGNDGWDAIADHSYREGSSFLRIMDEEIAPYVDLLCEEPNDAS